jgi:hypothetical protein
MKLRYLFFLLPLLCSCAAQIYFVGNTQPPTTKVDVWVHPQQITKTYEILGKAGYETEPTLMSTEELINQYITKAKKCGADGILFLESPITNMDTYINTTITNQQDTINRINAINTSTSIKTKPSNSYNNAYFIKYKQP